MKIKVGEFINILPRQSIGKGFDEPPINGRVKALQNGYLYKDDSFLTIIPRTRYYVPGNGDPIIGIITTITSDDYITDINARGQCLPNIPLLTFPSATRRNRPNISVGDIVYCVVEKTAIGSPAILSCKSNNNSYGKLSGGVMVNICSFTGYYLSRENCPLLAALSKICRFEIVVGRNCRAWVKGMAPLQTMTLANIIEKISNDELIDIETASIPTQIINQLLNNKQLK